MDRVSSILRLLPYLEVLEIRVSKEAGRESGQKKAKRTMCRL